jgi:hypothetical protein
VEQSYKQVKHELGYSDFQVRSDRAIRRHWQMVFCAFSYLLVGVHAARDAQGGDCRSDTREAARAGETRYRGGKVEQCCSQRSDRRMLSSWPVALREAQRWLDPWVMLWCFCRAWSNAPPPPALQALLDAVGSGQPLRFSFYV